MATRFPSWVQRILESDDDVVFVLDRDLHIAACNPGWDKFAAENNGTGISREEIQGRYIFDFIPDVLVTFYERKYAEALTGIGWIGFDYECSTPAVIRLFHMSMRMMENSALLVANSYLSDRRSPLPAQSSSTPEPAYLSPTGMITMCAHCRRTRRQDSRDVWDWVPRHLRLTGNTVSHGLCPHCVAYLYPESGHRQ